jgi:hypothetical protein
MESWRERFTSFDARDAFVRVRTRGERARDGYRAFARRADETRAIAARAVVKTRTRRRGDATRGDERRETGRCATRWRGTIYEWLFNTQ